MAAARSDHSHVWRRYLLLGSDRLKTLSLRNPRRSVSVGREAVCFLGKFAKACDPDFVSVPVLEYLMYCVIHRRGSFWHGTEGQRYRVVPERHHTTTAHANHRRKKRLIQFSVAVLALPCRVRWPHRAEGGAAIPEQGDDRCGPSARVQRPRGGSGGQILCNFSVVCLNSPNLRLTPWRVARSLIVADRAKA
jgi:hypothetical protein